MSNITSTANATVVAQEKLFTNLTPEEASVIEGGRRLTVTSLVCLRDGADSFSGDDVYANATVDGTTSSLNVGGMSAGDVRNLGWGFTFARNVELNFFDGDSPDSDDFLGRLSVSSPTNGIQKATIGGSGSSYRISYFVS